MSSGQMATILANPKSIRGFSRWHPTVFPEGLFSMAPFWPAQCRRGVRRHAVAESVGVKTAKQKTEHRGHRRGRAAVQRSARFRSGSGEYRPPFNLSQPLGEQKPATLAASWLHHAAV